MEKGDLSSVLMLMFFLFWITIMTIITNSGGKEVIVISTFPIEECEPYERSITEDGDTLYLYEEDEILNQK